MATNELSQNTIISTCAFRYIFDNLNWTI